MENAQIIIIKIGTTRTVHHLLVEWLLEIMLIPNRILTIRMPREAGGQYFTIVQKCGLCAFGAAVADALLQITYFLSKFQISLFIIF